MTTIKCIGVLTSGGDAPGMNAAIRAVTRTAIYNGLIVKGIMRGYKGLITGEIVDFTSSSVSNIIQKGGTILKTARCPEFREKEGRKQAYENMRKADIDALVVIGGDGTITGRRHSHKSSMCLSWLCPVLSIMTFRVLTRQSATTPHSIPLWRRSISCVIQRPRTNDYSLWRLWAIPQVISP